MSQLLFIGNGEEHRCSILLFTKTDIMLVGVVGSEEVDRFAKVTVVVWNINLAPTAHFPAKFPVVE